MNDTVVPSSSQLTTVQLYQLVVAPLSMISFLLSLFVIDQRNQTWRMAQHSNPETIWARLSSFFFFPPQSQPYPADGRSEARQKGTWSDDSHASWYLHTKRRAMAKLEISDAFELRGRVVVALFVAMLLLIVSAVYGMRHLYRISWVD